MCNECVSTCMSEDSQFGGCPLENGLPSLRHSRNIETTFDPQKENY